MKCLYLTELPSDVRETILFSKRKSGGTSRLHLWVEETGFGSLERKKDKTKTLLFLKCSWCHTPFSKPLYEVRKALKKNHIDAYCSADCRGKHHAVKNSTRVCAVCQTKTARKGSLYCSAECMKEKRASDMVKRLESVCRFCGKDFTANRLHRKFCNESCQNMNHSLNIRGAKNPRYEKGDQAPYGAFYTALRPLIVERDEGSCVACGWEAPKQQRSNGKLVSRLHVHHVDENPKNNYPENLVSLCDSCHRIAHQSERLPYSLLKSIAVERTGCMTSKLKERITSLQEGFLSTTAS